MDKVGCEIGEWMGAVWNRPKTKKRCKIQQSAPTQHNYRAGGGGGGNGGERPCWRHENWTRRRARPGGLPFLAASGCGG